MINTIVLLTFFGTFKSVAVNPAKVLHIAPITGVATPGCSLLLEGRENEVNVSGTCDEVKIKLGLGVK